MELTLERVSKQYREKWAVNQFSTTITPGIYGLLGPNGSGKSTLMRMIVNILKPTAGRILLDGRDIYLLGEQYRDLLGYLPQEFGVYRNFTAHRFLCYLAALKGIPQRQADKKINQLLDLINLKEMKLKKIRAFSGGMKQRLGIAQALLNDPHILILDEPTAGLDPNERIRFRNLLSEISSDRIVLLSTHIVTDVEYIAKDVIVMKKGQLLRQAPASELILEMKGKVWTANISESNLPSLKEKFLIGNVMREENNISLRIISDEIPFAGARPVHPDLEDYYLYYFGEEAKHRGTAAV